MENNLLTFSFSNYLQKFYSTVEPQTQDTASGALLKSYLYKGEIHFLKNEENNVFKSHSYKVMYYCLFC